MKALASVLVVLAVLTFTPAASGQQDVATFSIVAADPETGEVGIAVASRFFAVGSVVPYGKAGIGAVATQASADTTFGPRGLELLERGALPEEIVKVLVRGDMNANRRQFGIVASDGRSVSYTGKDCGSWAGGRHGANYAVQGNILAGEAVVVAMEATFLATKGTLAERMYAALLAGDAKGGDSRGKQSASLQVWKARAGYGGGDDRAIDLRVDDHTEPFKELGRLLDYAQMNYAWNEAWTLFMQKEPKEALPHMERAVRLAPANAEAHYDLAVIRLAAGNRDGALESLDEALALNPKLKAQSEKDPDLAGLRLK
ncbi:MAG: DUF1028 domain-containing protein [Thermoanaerobaculia bacterium]